MNRYIRHFLMDAAPDAGGGAPAAAPEAAPAAAPVAAPTQTALSGGDQSVANPYEFVPEKFRASKEDGSFDVDASFKKMAENYGNLEKRMGSGDAPPKDASGYEVKVPEQFQEHWKADDPQFQEFAAQAHELGFSQKQMDYMMDKFFEIVPAASMGGSEIDVTQCDEMLSQVWADPKQMEAGKKDAWQAVQAISNAMGVDAAEINDQLGNSPLFIMMMAKLAPEFREDTSIAQPIMNHAEDVNSLMRNEAYKNEKHPDHERVMRQVRAHYDRKFGSNQVM